MKLVCTGSRCAAFHCGIAEQHAIVAAQPRHPQARRRRSEQEWRDRSRWIDGGMALPQLVIPGFGADAPLRDVRVSLAPTHLVGESVGHEV
jgi:hypothetical protein